MKQGNQRSPLFVLLVVSAGAVSAACACLPTSVLEKYLVTREPVEATTEAPPAAEDLDPEAVCANELSDMLWEAEYYTGAGREMEAEYTLARYEVSGDTLSAPELPGVPEELEAYQQDRERHEEIWSFITGTFPAEYRAGVTEFILFTDGPGGTLGAVEQTTSPEEWMLEVDIQDAEDLATLATTLIHEVMHLFTLSGEQVATDEEVFNNPEDERAYTEGDAACDTYFLYEGCSEAESYINLFFERYWRDLYAEWAEIDREADEAGYDNLLADFYGRHADQFVSSYAATSPEEDIAESFLYFVLSPKPAGETAAEEKILFFYEFPELASLREHVRASLCEAVMR